MIAALKAASGGAILGIIGAVAASGLALSGFTYYRGHVSGKAACEAAQIKVDGQARDAADSYQPELIQAEGTYTDDLKNRGDEYEDAITQAELEDQYRYGVAAGRADARRDATDKGLAGRADRCLALPYDDGSDVRDTAISLQGDIFGNSDERDSAGAAGAGLRNRWPAQGSGFSNPEEGDDNKP